MTKDLNQNIENIDYNFLNLPSQIEMADIAGISKNNFMQYHYLSDGQKLSQKVFTNGEVSTTRDYCGRFVYENGKLSYIIHADGVVRAVYGTPGGGSVQINPEMGITITPADGGEVLSGFTREIHLKDHLGNVRAVFDYSKLQSENHYYPFGLPIHNLCSSTAPEGKENRYLYNGKELQDDLGLNWMDYGARFYDAGIGRWHSVDNSSENYYSHSPYNYVGNNPIRRVDPDGNDWLDGLLGFGAAVVDNTFGGMTDVRSYAANYVTDASDFNAGLTAGDVSSVVIGVTEILGGQGISDGGKVTVAVSMVAEIPSGGTSSVPLVGGAAAVATGETIKVHGGMMIASGTKNLANEKGHMNEGSNNSVGSGSQRNKPKESGTPNSSEIQSKNASGKTTKYSTYDKNGKLVKEFRGKGTGKDHGNVPRPNVKEPKYNTNPKTGEQFQNGYQVRPAKPNEIP